MKIPAQIDVQLVFTEGAQLLERAAAALPRGLTAERRLLRDTAKAVRDERRPAPVRLAAAMAPDVTAILDAHPLRDLVTEDGPYPVQVDRERALYGSWYEFFPRSEGPFAATTAPGRRARSRPPRRGYRPSPTWDSTSSAADPSHRQYVPQGRQQHVDAGRARPGRPLGDRIRSRRARRVHPELGTFDSFDDFVSATRARHGSRTRPCVTGVTGPSVGHRAPRMVQPPGGRDDRVCREPAEEVSGHLPLNFDNDPEGSYAEMLRIVRLWMDHGVRIFRVDNPHKPVSFWHRLLEEVRQTDPDVVFLAEAFTKPAMMHTLAKIGFGQSYTYFTWKNSKQELYEYFSELRDAAAYMRPNVFVNTPDILHAYLQYGGPAAFKIRAVLAAMLSPTWGVYSGYELFEHVAVRPGSEEYLDSEKYQYRPGTGRPTSRAARGKASPRAVSDPAQRHPPRTPCSASTAEPALPLGRQLRDRVLLQARAVARRRRGRRRHRREPGLARDQGGTISLDMPELGFDWHETFAARDELTGQTFHWGQFDFVRLDPAVEPAHVLTIHRLGT